MLVAGALRAREQTPRERVTVRGRTAGPTTRSHFGRPLSVRHRTGLLRAISTVLAGEPSAESLDRFPPRHPCDLLRDSRGPGASFASICPRFCVPSGASFLV